ncbi:MAG TPA: polysaccharide biosynthesis/export family protein [Candidatus Saccharimonadales bacterium]|jgi:polysaccharide export outer membrane protein|nr:polysaccharide biosynthesis/export family protein [Candidatus Saccharimonadales bacterium]
MQFFQVLKIASNRRNLAIALVLAASHAPAQPQLEASGEKPKAETVAPAGATDNRQDQKTAALAGGYTVGEGDLLRVNVWKETEISQNVTVRPDGNISMPLIDEFRVAGLTPRQIQELITEKLKAVLTNPQVTVTVTEVRSKVVYITGQIGKPGAYPVVAPTNVLQLIARAGGLNLFANRKDIYILRVLDRSRLRFNYKEVVKGKHSEQNVVLQPGDTVVVP